MVVWELRTKLSGDGWITVVGMETTGGRIFFPHPSDDSVILEASPERLEEILRMTPSEQARLNLRLEKRIIHVGKEQARERPETLPCPHCGESVTWIDPDFPIHTIPSCDGWRMVIVKGGKFKNEL